MTRFYTLFFIVIMYTLVIPLQQVFANVFINEIAWMGTTNSTFEEWIELYNAGDTEKDLTGWKIFKTGGTTLFTLSKTIGPGDYLLVCRTTASLTNPLGGICDEQGTFGGSGLNNETEELTLKDADGTVIETLSSGTNWATLGGDVPKKETAQKTTSGTWITAVATPGAVNAQTGSTTGSGGGSSSGGGGSSSGGGGSSQTDPDDEPDVTKKQKEDLVIEVKPDPKYVAKMILPGIIVQQVPAQFSADVTVDKIKKDLTGRFEWSMGDGTGMMFKKSSPFSYTYQEPGEYVVVMSYYSNIFREEPDTVHQKTITVIPAQVLIESEPTGSIKLTNQSTDTIDLAGWRIVSGDRYHVFPPYTLLRREKTITIPYSVHRLDSTQATKLHIVTPNHFVATVHKPATTRSSGTVLGASTQRGPEVYVPEEFIRKTIIEDSPQTQGVAKNIMLNPWMIAFFLLLIMGTVIIVRIKDDREDVQDRENDI